MKIFKADGLTINFGHIELGLVVIATLLMFKTAETPFQVAVLCFLVLIYMSIKNYAAIQPQLRLGREVVGLKRQRKVVAVLFQDAPKAIAIIDREIQELESLLLKQFWWQMARSVFCSLLGFYALCHLLTVL